MQHTKFFNRLSRRRIDYRKILLSLDVIIISLCSLIYFICSDADRKHQRILLKILLFFLRSKSYEDEKEVQIKKWIYRIAKSDDMSNASLWHDCSLWQGLIGINTFRFSNRLHMCVLLEKNM